MTPERLRRLAMDFSPDDPVQTELLQHADEIEDAWKQARQIGDELGISAEYLGALICGIGDTYANMIESSPTECSLLRDRVGELQKRIAELEEALKPFARWFRAWTGLQQLGDACPLSVDPSELDISARSSGAASVGDLRRAASILNREQPK